MAIQAHLSLPQVEQLVCDIAKGLLGQRRTEQAFDFFYRDGQSLKVVVPVHAIKSSPFSDSIA